MKVTVDQDNCISSGNCVMHSSEVFDQRDEDGVVVLLNENPPAEQTESVRRAAAECPAHVINIEESESSHV
jgi:ferredoxin